MGGWVGGWLENEFLKKTPSPKFGLESQHGTSDLEFVNLNLSFICTSSQFIQQIKPIVCLSLSFALQKGPKT